MPGAWPGRPDQNEDLGEFTGFQETAARAQKDVPGLNRQPDSVSHDNLAGVRIPAPDLAARVVQIQILIN